MPTSAAHSDLMELDAISLIEECLRHVLNLKDFALANDLMGHLLKLTQLIPAYWGGGENLDPMNMFGRFDLDSGGGGVVNPYPTL